VETAAIVETDVSVNVRSQSFRVRQGRDPSPQARRTRRLVPLLQLHRARAPLPPAVKIAARAAVKIVARVAERRASAE
jgi:hypothetical protein